MDDMSKEIKGLLSNLAFPIQTYAKKRVIGLTASRENNKLNSVTLKEAYTMNKKKLLHKEIKQ